MLGDLLAVATEHGTVNGEPAARESLERAFAFANDRHADQRRKSGEEFIIHPLEIAKICAGLRLDTDTLCAALLHDTVEDTAREPRRDRARTSARRSPGWSTA